jgi:hypothetical protein
MKKVWLSMVGLFLAVGVAGFLAVNCGGGDGDGDGDKDCTKVCEGLECGEKDGCTCGTCGEGETCGTDNMCAAERTEECVEKCAAAECGDVEGCDCGTCGEGFECQTNACVPEGTDCTAACEGKECGEVEGCDCGACEDGFECNASNMCECVPVCADGDGNAFECGDDGCGGSCGDCAYGECTDHACVCEPQCDGKDCGPDGCGGQCGTCEDGFICQAGACLEKGVCTMDAVTENVQKVVYMEIGKGGKAGEALDVDGDPDTCAPAGDCEDGLNNQLSGLLGQLEQFVDADAEIANALAEGSIILVAEMVDMAIDGTEFTMNMYIGELAEEGCDFQTAKCGYYVKPDSFDPVSCKPVIAFENTTITDGKLVAGGPDNIFKVTIPVSEDLILDVTANMAQVTGDVTGDGDGMMIENGLIGGAVRKDKLMEAVDLIPEDAELPVSKDMIKNLLDMFIQPDVDTDDDGTPDGASIGVKFSTIAGTITGLEPEAAE